MTDKSKLGGFVWKSQLLGISARKLWAWGGRHQNRGVRVSVCWCPEERAGRPEKAPRLRLQQSGLRSINSSPHSFIHSSDPAKGRNDKQTFIGYQPCAKRERRLCLLVPRLIFTVRVKYYFHPIKAKANRLRVGRYVAQGHKLERTRTGLRGKEIQK